MRAAAGDVPPAVTLPGAARTGAAGLDGAWHGVAVGGGGDARAAALRALPAGHAFELRLRALSAAGASEWSPVAGFSTDPAPPEPPGEAALTVTQVRARAHAGGGGVESPVLMGGAVRLGLIVICLHHNDVVF